MKMRHALLVLILLVNLGNTASAHPVPYKGALGVMTWNQPFLSDEWITYSFRPDAAIAARHMRMETAEGRSDFFAPQLNFLVKRWNLPAAQANIYAYGSYGLMRMNKVTSGAGLVGVEADAESRKLFVSGKYERMWGGRGPDFYQTSFRVGAAPYEAEFNELASWLMVQYQYHPMLTRKHAVTPLIRLFYKSVLFEAGVSTDADWMLNLMFHF